MPLDIKAEVGQIRKFYDDDPKQHTFNVLLTSESGCGKTFIGRTCPFPMHIDSFDPGGTKCLRDHIKAGDIIADTRYESENPEKPDEYAAWKRTFEARLRSGYFEHFATYMLDSSTTWAEAIINWVMKKDGVAGQAPRFTKDYTPQKVEIRNMLRKILDLPCNVILTGHLKLVEDPEGGKHKFRYLTTGQGMVTIPLLFDELWTLRARTIGQKTKYELLTQPTSLYLSRSRLAQEGKLDPIEVPDVRAIMKKVGMPANDKPKLDI